MNHICGNDFEAQSAGLEPGTLNPLAVEAMREVGIDISKKEPSGFSTSGNLDRSSLMS